MTATLFNEQTSSRSYSRERGIRVWLVFVAVLVFAMIVVGGATRLTDSGLSITEWQPILGAIPPLSEADWQSAFSLYKQIPEYHIVNKGMSLAEFKAIYWWEWSHRFLGRIIGIAFALPLAAFWFSGWLHRGTKLKLVGVLALGGLQGVIGWYMVKSGLVDRIDVSQYRLALHLGVAFLIFGLLVWMALETGAAPREHHPAISGHDQRFAVFLLGAVVLQVVLGAFVAGLKAGLTYNSWPLMDGRLLPHGLFIMEPWFLNLFENVTTVQFNHRMMAYAVVALSLWHAVRLRRSVHGQGEAKSAIVLAVTVIGQAALGVWTLLAHVPLSLGLAHQGGAAIVLGVAVWHVHRMTRGIPLSH